MNAIRAHASPEAACIYGAAYDETLGESIRVTVLAAGAR
jgi:cell division protein FtsZ